METIYLEQIYFKRGNKADLNAVLIGDKKPAQGEPVYELDTGRLKIGDGIHDYIELDYIAGDLSDYTSIGYRNVADNKFYRDPTYQVEVNKVAGGVYMDANGTGTYKCDGTNFTLAEEAAQIVKLYKTHGSNEDGTMTQKCITDGVNSIKFALETSEDEDADGLPENVLILDLPWD